jgi:hypothetical protein
MSKIDAWRQLREETLQNLDIRRAYEEFGVKFTGKISASNWAECHAFGREDKSPSAAVNLTTGVYKDFAGDRASIFDFMVAHNIAPSWQEAQEELAKKCGLAKKIPKKAKAKRTQDVLGFTNTFNLASVVPLARQYGIEPQTIAITGARMARYPASSQEPQIVCAFPIYSPISLLDSPPDSYVLQSGSGQPIMVYQGPDVPAKPEKRIVVGTTGILNKFALENWGGAERIYKVEGLSDMLVLQNFIPDEYRTKHLVITNACGCDDGAPAWELANHCVGKEIIIIHDADVPGQFGNGKDQSGGAQRWIKALKSTAKVLKNVQLPYEIQSKHGKDLRNWIAEEGRKYSDLLEIVTSTRDEVTGTTETGTGGTTLRTPTQQLLDRLSLIVLGHMEGRVPSIVVFHQKLTRRFEITDIDKYTYNKMLTTIGDDAKNDIDPSPEPSPAKIAVNKLREAIAYEASGRRISRASAIGLGIWEINHKLIFVGSGQWLAMNGDLRTRKDPEIDDKLVDFGEGKESWYNEEEIRRYLPHATDPAWRTEVLKEFAGWFELWDNWGEGEEENRLKSYLVASLAMCSWLQTIWSWRPWVAITGETNSGKTTFFKFMSKYFGQQMAVNVGNATEAGLRQMLGTSSRIMLLDEFEASKERTKILDWLKNSGAGGSSVRGTPGQRSVSSTVSVIPWFGATETGMKNETERNRYVLFNMASRIDKPFFELPSDERVDDMRCKTLAILLRVWARAKEIHHYLKSNCNIEGIYSRYTESYSLPCAMWSAVVGHTNEEAKELFNYAIMPMLEGILFNTESEHATLVSDISSAKVHVGRGDTRVVNELLTSASYDTGGVGTETPEKILSRVGIRKMRGGEFRKAGLGLDDRYIFIAHRIVAKELLKGDAFGDKGIDQLLLRVSGSFHTRQRLSSGNMRGVAIPWTAMFPKDDQASADAGDSGDSFVPPEHRTISSEVF